MALGICRDCKYRSTAEVLDRAESRGGLEAVYLGHAQIHDDYLRTLFDRNLESFLAVGRFDHLMPEFLEHVAVKVPAVIVVFNQQYKHKASSSRLRLPESIRCRTNSAIECHVVVSNCRKTQRHARLARSIAIPFMARGVHTQTECPI